MFQQSDSGAKALPSISLARNQRISEDQAILSFPEDEHRLTDAEAPGTRYGAVSSDASSNRDADEGEEKAQEEETPEELGCGGRLYVGVLIIVAAAGLVALSGIVRKTPASVVLETDANFPFTTTTRHPLRPTSLWGSIERPYPTGAWWLNIVMGDGDYPVAPLPYTIRATDDGVGVSYSAMRRVVTLDRVQDTYAEDLRVSTVEPMDGHGIVKYDNLTVTIQHDIRNGGSFRTLAARGSPYMTFEFAGTTPMIESNGEILEVDGQDAKVGSSVHGTTFKLALSNWETWLVYTSESVTWTLFSKHAIQMEEAFSGITRVAVLPHPWDKESEEALTQHAYAYPRGGEIAFDIDGDNDRVEMRYEWAKDGFGDLLMMALPHHMDTMELENLEGGGGVGVVMQDSYLTIKGPMTGIVGSVWTMRDNLTDIQWTARTPLDHGCMSDSDTHSSVPTWKDQLRQAVADDVHTTIPTAPDVYGFGKEVARMARLALIADEVGDGVSRDSAVATLDAYLTPWMKNDNADLLVYDKTWGGLVTKDGLNDENADFGNGWYNDHTYHNGYLLYAAAVLTKYRPTFFRKHQEQLRFLVADVAGACCGKHEVISKLFPTARQKDFYDGHSWTSGLFLQGNGKSQESVSESINAYYGIYLLGLAAGESRMRDWGRVLLTLELRAARKYWQMPEGNGVYDSFFSSRRMVGMIASLEAVQSTWFGGNTEYVHCINMLPFTPITEELLRPRFVQQEWPVLQDVFDNGEPAPQWAGFMSLAGAVVLPQEAWANISATNIFDAGNSKANSLYWIATRPRGGSYNASRFGVELQVDPQCKANSACRARGLGEDKMCCPTEDGHWLGCCPTGDGLPEGPSACAASSQCVLANLKTGLCCPTLAGEMLACCEQSQSGSQQVGSQAEPDDADPQALCSSNEGCSSLEGLCCPTNEGIYLGCCGAVHVSAESANKSAPFSSGGSDEACSSRAGCASLQGFCCPTPEGLYLACCEYAQDSSQDSDIGISDADRNGMSSGSEATERACGSHPGCEDLEGDCCPTSDGTMLGCCVRR